jgi:hypothetical protein
MTSPWIEPDHREPTTKSRIAPVTFDSDDTEKAPRETAPMTPGKILTQCKLPHCFPVVDAPPLLFLFSPPSIWRMAAVFVKTLYYHKSAKSPPPKESS